MDVQRILWPTDFSQNAAQALPVVTSLAQKYQAEIHLLNVITANSMPIFGSQKRLTQSTEEIAKVLNVNGIIAAAYHAGLDAKTRTQVQRTCILRKSLTRYVLKNTIVSTIGR